MPEIQTVNRYRSLNHGDMCTSQKNDTKPDTFGITFNRRRIKTEYTNWSLYIPGTGYRLSVQDDFVNVTGRVYTFSKSKPVNFGCDDQTGPRRSQVSAYATKNPSQLLNLNTYG